MKVCIEQMKPVLGDTEKNLLKMVEKIDEAIKRKEEIIIFPELSLNGYMLEDLVFNSAVKDVPEILLEKSKEISIIFGAVELGEEEYPYNTAFYLEDGKVVSKHREVYLPNYGMFQEGRYFIAGDKFRAFDTKFGRVGMLIGEDMWHQSAQYILAQDGVKYIYIITNALSRVGINKHDISKPWRNILKSISMLNGVYTIMANRVGVEDGVTFFGNSIAVDPYGEVIGEADFFKEQSLSCCIDENKIRTARINNPIFKSENLDLTIRELKRIQKKRFE